MTSSVWNFTRRFFPSEYFSSDPSILEKYQKASEIASSALELLISRCQPGEKISLLFPDNQFILEECKRLNPESTAADNLNCGLALPTIICKNNCIGNWAPYDLQVTADLPTNGDTSSDSASSVVPNKNLTGNHREINCVSYLIEKGDLIKVEVGVHIDGYISTAAHSFVAGHHLITNSPAPVTGRIADVLVAAFSVNEQLKSCLLLGTTSISNIYQAINKIARMYSCS